MIAAMHTATAGPGDRIKGEKLGTMTGPVRSDVFAVGMHSQVEYPDVASAVAAAQQISMGADKPALGVFLGPGSSSVFGAYLLDLSSTKPNGSSSTPIHIEGVDAAFELHPFTSAVVDGATVVYSEGPFTP